MPGMMRNHVKAKLATGGYALGVGVTFVRNPSVMRLIAAAGYDFAFIDMEHSAFSIETVSDMCEVARAVGLVPIVRPQSHDGKLANRILDVGAMGLMEFDVTSREQVDAILGCMRFPPAGMRGQSSGAVFDYQDVAVRDGNQFVNDNTMLVILIESRSAVENIDQILEGGGIDVVDVGRSDLSKSLGVPGERRNPAVLEAVDRVAEACRRHVVALGSGLDSREDAEDLIRRGARFLFYPNDLSAITTAFRQGSDILRTAIANRDAIT